MSPIKVEKFKEKRIVHVKMNLPEKRNILSLEMIEEFTDYLERLQEDPDIQVLILSGAGANFSAGGDLNWMLLKEEISDTENINQIRNLSQLFNRLWSFPHPIYIRCKRFCFWRSFRLDCSF